MPQNVGPDQRRAETSNGSSNGRELNGNTYDALQLEHATTLHFNFHFSALLVDLLPHGSTPRTPWNSVLHEHILHYILP